MTHDILLLRPLIEFTRTEIFLFIKSKKISIQIDPTNFEISLSRNRIRKQLIPYLKHFFNSNLESKIIQLIKLLESETQFLKISICNKFLFSKGKFIFLNISIFIQLPIFLQRKIVFYTFQLLNIKNINFEIVETFRLFLYKIKFFRKKNLSIFFKPLKIKGQIIKILSSTYIKFL